VAAGTLEQLAALAADPPPKTRVIPLQVAGAFHTSHMAPAVDALVELTAGMTTADPQVRLLSNADGAVVDSGADALTRLVRQVSSPVRWDLCMQTLVDLGVTALVELPPAGTLVGLAKRAMPGVTTLAVKTPDDLAAAHDLIREHGDPATAPSPTSDDAQEV
jgi:[acyl-carrier-protein] S-malonyltransferase